MFQGAQRLNGRASKQVVSACDHTALFLCLSGVNKNEYQKIRHGQTRLHLVSVTPILLKKKKKKKKTTEG